MKNVRIVRIHGYTGVLVYLCRWIDIVLRVVRRTLDPNPKWGNTMRMFNVLAVFCIVLMAGAAFGATLNEIRIDQGGSDYDEYIEIAGTPGESLDGLWVITVGDGAGAHGTIETALDLTGYVIAADGVFLAVEDTWSGTCGDTPDAVVGTALNFENSDNLTFFLVDGFTGIVGDDIDIADDGVIDNVLWTSILDDVALVETPDSGDFFYSTNTVGPDGTYVPGHVAFCGGMWQMLDFDLCIITETPGEPSDEFCGPVPTEASNFGSLKAQYR